LVFIFYFIYLFYYILLLLLFFFFNFGNADLFCLILQLGWCCHSDVCGIPHCVPEVHGKFYAWSHQDKSHPMDGRVSSRTCNLFWLPGDSDSVHYSFVTIIKYHSALYIHVTVHHNRFLFNNQPDALIIQIYSVIKLYMFRGILSAHHQEFSTVHSALLRFVLKFS